MPNSSSYRLAAVLVFGCFGPVLHAADPAPAQPVQFDELWNYSRSITTTSAVAQRFFDQGLGFLYAFNHDEAIRAFAAAASHAPNAPMPYWGIAYANGPHINFPLVDDAHAAAAWSALIKARERLSRASPVEQALIEALSQRYALPQPEDRLPLDQAYARAMRAVWQKHPRDADVGALYAEALMDLHPWDQWQPGGQPRDDTELVLATLEAVLDLSPQHPLALHLYIHALEGSPQPERAAAAAETLRKLPIRLGHLVHMPSHIDVRLGHWGNAIETNVRAIAADTAYRQAVPEQGFYRTYMAHNYHMLAFAAMMRGQSALATDTIQNMLEEIPVEYVRENGLFVDAFFAMPYEMYLRFGRWDEVLAEPEPVEQLPVSRAMRLYARGVARAAKKDPGRARIEQQAFRAARTALPEDAIFVLNSAADVLAVADRLLEGEILYREGTTDAAITALAEAVELEDALRYIEPPDWIQPSRHVLGATLCDAGRWAAAGQVYRADLVKHPHNGWSLFGLGRSLRMQGKPDEAERVAAEFRRAWQDADFELTSSCLCLPSR